MYTCYMEMRASVAIWRSGHRLLYKDEGISLCMKMRVSVAV